MLLALERNLLRSEDANKGPLLPLSSRSDSLRDRWLNNLIRVILIPGSLPAMMMMMMGMMGILMSLLVM